MEFMSAREAAEKWGISQRRVAVLCSENRIDNATMVGNMWIIPQSAKKPVDKRSIRYNEKENTYIKPFLKWAGGKGKLISEIKKYYPFEDKAITKYAEPFVGGGAVLFDILRQFELNEIYISDTNFELVNVYQTVRDNIWELICLLERIEGEFLGKNTDERKKFYLEKRKLFNELKINDTHKISVERASLMIFLNKTCFNGLYRVNKKGLFNVPMGSYKSPLICDRKTLMAVSERLQQVNIVCVDYKKSRDFIDKNTFVYFDPPYRPLTDTSSFTAYTNEQFGDKEQIELAKFFDEMDRKGAKILLSNSDPKNVDEQDNFFDDIYSSHRIRRIEAFRMINSKGNSRGKIKELLISNF
ncbi:DNA adenine methylase [uncultured Finegoldia sp.]|uniref:DNA adenine methylase n=1 Tax=uncultured Finegoldia sp. TaxID=328009 RepID=UPI00260D4ABD|nr:Dam family site-specific DNA-(adenine-N6)-methyltransferase [uncultured Finegoldia sp.]